jgi:putative membrane protein
MKTRSGKWSEWLTLPEDGTFAWPQKAQGEIRLRPLTTLVCATLVCGLFALQALAQTTIQEFVTKVAISDMFEIQSGKIATQKGNANIKSFAERMVKDHTKTSQELKSMVENGKARLPTTLDGEHERQLEQLHTLEGEQFNSTYANMQIQAHEEAVTLFEEYSRSGTDLELQAWASKTLPALEERLEHAKKLK